MSPERHQKICDVFADAQEIPDDKRSDFLAEVCGDDAELRAEVESLLASDAGSGNFIKTPAIEVAAGLMAADQKNSKIGLEIGQYKILSLLGTGGMGEVWLASDTRLKRQVALKLLTSVQKPDLLVRFEQEAYAASALNHPNIITIFDIGESAGHQFIATELIDGKTLRQISGEKHLTFAQAVDIAIQVCTALAAAHRAGIIHRDIKPENIMVRADGIVKVLDFGLARFTEKNVSNPDAKFITKPGMIMGTVSYMSPEQARALPVDDRTDIFSLGIVLFEMLAGELPFQGANEIETLAAILERQPVSLADSIPESLRKIVAAALQKNHLERPTAAQLADELKVVKRKIDFSTEIINQKTAGSIRSEETIEMNVPAANRQSEPSIAVAKLSRFPALPFLAAAVLLVATLAYFGYGRWFGRPPVLTDGDQILIAEFVNRTGDEEFDDVFRQPLALSLAQSPFFLLVSDGQIRQTLKTMEKSPDERLTAEIAREIGQRRGIKAFLVGSIENYGVEYQLSIEAFSSETGESVAFEAESAKNKEAVLAALSTASDKMRRKLGESLASIERFDASIQHATTESLEALRAYSLANKRMGEGKNDEAITLLNRAIEIDADFAVAYASLGTVYFNKGQMSKAEEFAAKAFALRDRATEREKLKIADFYYAAFTGESDKNIETLELFRQTYPRDLIPLVNLGAAYTQLGKFSKSEEAARNAIALDPTIFIPYANLGRALNLQGRYDEARLVFEDMERRGFDNPQINTGLFTAAFARGDEAEMQKQIAALEKKDPSRALLFQGNPLIFAGKWREYDSVISQAVSLVEKDEPDTAADYAAQAAVNGAALGKCADAEKWSGRALKLDRGSAVLTDAALSLTLCGRDAGKIIGELKEKYPKNTVVNSMWLPIIRAAAEIQTSPERALETLEINRQFEGGTYFWDNFLRGRVYEKLGKPELAAAEFLKITQNRGWSTQSPLFALAHRELAQNLLSTGDSAGHAKYDEIFRKLWKDADADLTEAPSQSREQ